MIHIINKIERPSKEIIEKFREIGTVTIHEGSGRKGGVKPAIRPGEVAPEGGCGKEEGGGPPGGRLQCGVQQTGQGLRIARPGRGLKKRRFVCGSVRKN